MQGIKRKVIYVSLFEGIAIIMATFALAGITGHGVQTSGVVAVVASAIAIAWNLAFNTVFERWEARQAVRGRSLGRRAVHAIGFEGGLVVFLVPVFAWWFGISLVEALVMDLGMLVFFLFYAFIFNWSFDRVFGLPASAAGPQRIPPAVQPLSHRPGSV